MRNSQNQERPLLFHYSEEFREGFGVPIVLAQGVLEMTFLPIKDLRPLGLLLVSINPALDVLRFNHEDPVFRDNDMVDLGCPIGGRYGHIVDGAVDLRVEPDLGRKSSLQFADPPFEG